MKYRRQSSSLRKYVFSTIIALGVLGMSSAGIAAPMLFFGEDLTPGGIVPSGGGADTARNDFLNAGNFLFSVESYENLTDGQAPSFNVSFTGAAGTFDGVQNVVGGNSPIDEVHTGPEIDALSLTRRFPTDGDNFYRSGLPDAFPNDNTATGHGFEILLDTPVSAFGLFVTDAGDFEGRLNIQLGNSTPFVVDHAFGSATDGGSLLFWGVVDPMTSFSQIIITTDEQGRPAPPDVMGFDELLVGIEDEVPMPEPGTFALLWLGGLVIAARRRRS